MMSDAEGAADEEFIAASPIFSQQGFLSARAKAGTYVKYIYNDPRYLRNGYTSMNEVPTRNSVGASLPMFQYVDVGLTRKNIIYDQTEL